jgi:hypothetical protein
MNVAISPAVAFLQSGAPITATANPPIPKPVPTPLIPWPHHQFGHIPIIEHADLINVFQGVPPVPPFTGRPALLWRARRHWTKISLVSLEDSVNLERPLHEDQRANHELSTLGTELLTSLFIEMMSGKCLELQEGARTVSRAALCYAP